MQITLARALKLKNRLAGQLAKLGQRAIAHNSYVEGTANAYDSNVVFDDYAEVRDQLIEVKAKIQIANAPIQEKIIRIGELRSQVSLLQSMNVTEGPVHTNRFLDDKEVVHNYLVHYTKSERDEWVEEIESDIDTLQDEIDTHNAVTRVELSFDL